MSRWAIANPKRMLAIWGAVAGLLALAGIGVADRLHNTDILIPDTPAGKTEKLSDQRFGESSGILILLKGPKAALNHQGPKLARTLDGWKDVTVTSPWTPGLGSALAPKPDQALLLVRIQQPFEASSEETVPRIRDQLDREVTPPVVVHMTGFADIANAIHTDTIKAIEKAELIAAPLLIIILLLVFRSPIAAAVPLALGLTTVGAAGGVLDIVNRLTVLDVVSFNLASMMGLALGVDYSLLLVSRFREELANGQEVRFAVQTAVTRAGHTVRFAGLALGVAMAAALLVSPGKIMLSSVVGVLIATILSVLTAITALPAVLMLLGKRINMWRFGQGAGSPGVAAAALRALRRPALAGGIVLVAVIAIAAPALAIETGPPDPRTLPKDSKQRQDFEAIRHTLGDGWGAPYEVIVASRHGPVTTGRNLEEIQKFQDRLARDNDVLEVFGPGAIARQTAPLRKASGQLVKGGKQLSKSQQALGRLGHGLSRAAHGSAQLQAGIETASTGATKLASGGDSAQEGALQLQAGLATSQQGAALLAGGLGRSTPGLKRLAEGARAARGGAQRLRTGLLRIRRGAARGLPGIRKLRKKLGEAASGLDQLRQPVGIADDELAKALAALDAMLPTTKSTDPNYFKVYQSVDRAAAALAGTDSLTGQAVFPGYDGLDNELAAASASAEQGVSAVEKIENRTESLLRGTKRLTRGGAKISAALGRLSAGAARLSGGGQRAISGAGRLSSGLARLDSGAGSLADGVVRLQSGARRLADGLQSGSSRSDELVSGVKRLQNGVVTFQARTKSSSSQLKQTGRLGKVLGSGYATLAAVDTSEGLSRSAASQTVNLNNGGTAARILVVEHGASNRPGSPLRAKLDDASKQLAAQTGAVVRVGGPAPSLQDFDSAVADSFPWLIVVLCALTYLVLIPLLRSVVLPLIAVVLNVLTVAAALGVLTLLFGGSAPLGGPGFIDDIMRTSIFGLVFALSIDYEVFLLARMREGYVNTRDPDAAIEYGLRTTAGVITGAALIMTGVFIAFALAPVISMRELGVGLTVAVLLDTTVIRLILLPATMRLAGERIWWMPDWMHRLFGEERRTPGLEPEMARVRRLAG